MEDGSDFLVFGAPILGEQEISEVVDSLRSGWIGTGPKVGRFERALEAYIDVPHVRCVSSCTAALILSMKALGVGPGDEVILPTMTFVATANAIEHVGAKPVLIDSADDGTGLIDLEAVEAAITPKTRALMPVHLAGLPLDLDRLGAIADKHQLAVIEDAAHAIGARWGGDRIGSHGNLVAFSFYVTKNLTTIEGGAVATTDPELAASVERLALHGLSAGAWERYSDAGFKHYEVVEPGFKFNMTDVQAAVGIHQLPRLDEWNERRTQLWLGYDELLADLQVELPSAPECARAQHARHLYRIELGSDDGLRDQVMEALRADGIGTGVHYRAVHLHPFYRDKYGLDPGEFPVSTRSSDRSLSLPLAPWLTEEDQGRVVRSLRRAIAK